MFHSVQNELKRGKGVNDLTTRVKGRSICSTVQKKVNLKTNVTDENKNKQLFEFLKNVSYRITVKLLLISDIQVFYQ